MAIEFSGLLHTSYLVQLLVTKLALGMISG